MGLYGKGDRDKWAQVGRLSESTDDITVRVEALEAAGLRQGVAVADSTASDVAALVSDFNGLLASLRGAGLIAT